VTGIEPAWPAWKGSETLSRLSVKRALTCAHQHVHVVVYRPPQTFEEDQPFRGESLTQHAHAVDLALGRQAPNDASTRRPRLRPTSRLGLAAHSMPALMPRFTVDRNGGTKQANDHLLGPAMCFCSIATTEREA
jgi:hypothetical protein